MYLRRDTFRPYILLDLLCVLVLANLLAILHTVKRSANVKKANIVHEARLMFVYKCNQRVLHAVTYVNQRNKQADKLIRYDVDSRGSTFSNYAIVNMRNR